jgi:hypothetical protein
VEASSKRACKQALEMFCSAVRTTLNACQGYECQEKDGIFMLAFSEAGGAGRANNGLLSPLSLLVLVCACLKVSLLSIGLSTAQRWRLGIDNRT